MAEIIIYTDPHLGRNRKANSTAESNQAREGYENEYLLNLLKAHKGPVFCLGDFFDKASNPEEVILSALPIADQTDLILAGNHDVSNRLNKESSLRLVGEVYPNKVLIDTDRAFEGYTTLSEQTYFYFAPHALNQEGYDQTIAKLEEEANSVTDVYKILCLHCNYALPEAFLNEQTLNLSRERAAELLGTFHYILIGHVHTQLDDFDGRLKVIGSPFPTAFDNMDRKRVLLYDSNAGTFNEIPTWDPATSLYRGIVSGLIPEHSHASATYFDLEDDLLPGEAHSLVVELFKQGAYGVRLRKTEKLKGDELEISSQQFERLPDTIDAEIKHSKPHLHPVWTELLEKSQ